MGELRGIVDRDEDLLGIVVAVIADSGVRRQDCCMTKGERRLEIGPTPQTTEENRPGTSRSQTDAETLVETEDEMEKVMAAITNLPERYQTVLILRYLKGLSNKEISVNLAEPDGTIRNRLFRALDKLRTLLRKTPVSGGKGNPSRERKTGSIQ